MTPKARPSTGPPKDPTENVYALVEADAKRHDDLRKIERKLVDEKILRVEQLIQIRSDHAKEMRDAETRRVDAVRQVDVLNQSIGGDRQLVAIQTLAATSNAQAEALRATVATTATSIAASTASAMATVNERLAALELSSAKGEGKQAVADPMVAELLSEVKSLRTSRATDVGGSDALAKGRQRTIAILAVIVSIAAVIAGALVGVAGIIITVILKLMP